MATVVDTVRSRAAFVRMQTAEGRHSDALQQDQVKKLMEAFDAVHLTVDDVNEILAVLNEGPWTDDQIVGMSSRLSDILMHSESPESIAACTKTRRSLQTMLRVENYITEKEFDQMGNKEVTMDAKLQIMGNRLASVGVTCPNASLLKRAAAIVCVLSGVDPTNANKENMVQRLRRVIKSVDEASVARLPHLQTFPETPSDLTRERYAAAYNEDNLPAGITYVNLDLGAVNAMEAQVAYKKTHKDLRTTMKRKAEVPILRLDGVDGAANAGNVAMQLMNTVNNTMQNIASVIGDMRSASADMQSARLSILKQPPAQEVTGALALTDAPAPEAPATGADRPQDVVTEMEQRMASAKKGLAKPKAKAKAKAKTKAKPTPNAKAAESFDDKAFKHKQGRLTLTVQNNNQIPFFKIFDNKQQVLQARIGADKEKLFKIMKTLMTQYANKKVRQADLRRKRDEMLAA